MKFLLVQLFNPKVSAYDDYEYLPFWLNLSEIVTIRPYDKKIHAKVFYDPDPVYEVPEGAPETIFVDMGNKYFHLDVESSKKILEYIKKET